MTRPMKKTLIIIATIALTAMVFLYQEKLPSEKAMVGLHGLPTVQED